MRVVRTIALMAALCCGCAAATAAEEIDALFLGGYWCAWQDKTKTEAIPRSRVFLQTRLVDAAGSTSEANFTEYLVDVTGDIRGQRVLLLQRQKNTDGTACKVDCMVARRIVNSDLLEHGEWNATTGVFKSATPREYLYRCEK